jgi:hypothetical protein
VTAPTPEVVTWIRVQKPALDIVGIILGSIAATTLLSLLALLLGALGAVGLIRHRNRPHDPGSHLVRLRLDAPRERPASQ